MEPLPAIESFSAFARRLQRKPAWVTQLRKEGRLVLAPDGRQVKVAESLQRIADTSDPARLGVVERHAAERAAKAGADVTSPSVNATAAPADATPATGNATPSATPSDADADAPAVAAKESSMFQHWRERGERAKALAAERDNAIAEGKLMDATAVLDAVKSHYASTRAGFEALPDFLAPQLVGVREEPKIRALIAEAIESKLTELSRQFGLIAKETA